jgi:hypothetical protein
MKRFLLSTFCIDQCSGHFSVLPSKQHLPLVVFGLRAFTTKMCLTLSANGTTPLPKMV